MKYIYKLIIATALIISGIMTGCKKDDTAQLQGINLNVTEVTLGIGDIYTLKAETVPANIQNLTYDWISSNPEVASVDTNGTVTALSIGESLVSVICGDFNASCRVTVSTEGSGIRSVTVTPAVAELLVNGTVDLEVTVDPSDAEYSISWSSSNESVATVSADGTVTGIATGNAIITADAGGKTGECRIAVVNIPVESITVNQHELQMTEMEVQKLSATVLPENADNKTVTWTSSDERVAVVNGAGEITAIGAGEAVIKAQAGNVTDECTVTVTSLPLAVGYFYYSDGSWSASLDPGKEVIGVVAHVGDMTLTDKALAREHPECRHGLVVSLDESEGIAWQSKDSLYYDRVGTWIDANLTEYETITTDVNLEDNLNKPMGYNNTKAIEAFNAAPENSQWPVEVVEYVVAYRDSHPLPDHTSGWYLGSAKEMSLIASGEYDKNIWDIRDAGISVKNLQTVNESMAQIQNAELIGTMGFGTNLTLMFYWTSTERGEPEWDKAFCMVPANGQMPNAFKSDGVFLYRVRPIFAF